MASTGPPFTGTLTVVLATSDSFTCHKLRLIRHIFVFLTWAKQALVPRFELLPSGMSMRSYRSVKRKTYPVCSSANWPRAFRGTRRTIDLISWRTLKRETSSIRVTHQGNRLLKSEGAGEANAPFFLVSWGELSSHWWSPNPVPAKEHKEVDQH